jgi:hypothetical protein
MGKIIVKEPGGRSDWVGADEDPKKKRVHFIREIVRTVFA